jgi:hypothetical protein
MSHFCSLGVFALIVLAGAAGFSEVSVAQAPKCGTVAECAQQAVDAAARSEAAVSGLRKRIDELESEIATVKRFAPYSFTATGCAVGKEVGVLFALHDFNITPPPPAIEFTTSGENAAGLIRHDWAQLHVCKW